MRVYREGVWVGAGLVIGAEEEKTGINKDESGDKEGLNVPLGVITWWGDLIYAGGGGCMRQVGDAESQARKMAQADPLVVQTTGLGADQQLQEMTRILQWCFALQNSWKQTIIKGRTQKR